MIELICYLFPAIISVDYFVKRDLKAYNNIFIYLSTYMKSVIVNIVFSYFILFFFSDFKGATIFHTGVSFVLQYFIIALVLSFIMPRVYIFIKNHISFELRLRRIKNEKNI